MSPHRILIIDDEASIRSSLRGILEDEGYAVTTAASGEDGLAELPKQSFGLVLLDIWLPGLDGLEVSAPDPDPRRPAPGRRHLRPWHGRNGRQSHQAGGLRFPGEPLTLEKVVLTVKNALRQRKLEEENLRLREQVKTRYHLVGKSAAILRLRDEIKKAAPTDGRVLLTGENGRARSLSPAWSTTRAAGVRSASSRSTAPPSRTS